MAGLKRVMCKYCFEKVKDERVKGNTVSVVAGAHPECEKLWYESIGRQAPVKDKDK